MSINPRLFSFADQADLTERHEPLDRLEEPMPRGFMIEERGNELLLIRRWFSPKYLVLTFFVLF